MNLHLESLVDGKFSKKTKGSIILIFLIVPFISSVISMIHVVKFLSLGNTSVVAITLAITYEIANLTILMAMVLMKKLRAFFVWACFIVLLSVQIVGNVYYSYDYILVSISGNPGYLTTFISFIQEMIEFENNKTIVFTLACFLGLPIPMVSLFLVKSVVDYLELGTNEPELVEEIEEVKIKEEEKVEFKPEPVTAPIISAQEVSPGPIEFKDTEKLVEEIKEVIENTAVAENSSEVIHTEEEDSKHIGVTIRPQDENNNEHRE